MPTFTVYSLGDVSSFWTMLNGIAMFFNDNGFIQSAALAGSLVMLVLMLVGVLAKTGGGQGGHSPVLGPLYLGATFVFMTIPTSVVLEDIYTGSIIKVDNIPLIISLPSSMFTTGAYKIFKSADTVFQSVDGSYMSVSSNGLVTPMKLLMSMRKGLSSEAPILAMNIKMFAKDCLTSSPILTAGISDSNDALTYMFDHSNPTSLTFDFPVSSETPVDTNCEQEAIVLKDRSANFLGGTDLADGNVNKLINTNMTGLGAVKIDKTTYDLGDTQAAVNNIVTSHLGAASKDAQALMSNLIMYDVIKTGLACSGVATNAEAASACWTAVAAERQAAEQWKSDAAGAGSMFSKLMVPAITFMQLMFYGFSPLILIFALFAGEKSIGLVAKYMMFGVWTVSWLPFAAVIQMYIQNQVADRVSQLGKLSANGITLSNTSDFYNMVSTNLGLASDLLAATPMISFALLSGSAMAMTSMAGRWGGRDYTDEKAMSPSAMTNGALVQNAPVMEQNQYSGGGSGYTDNDLSFKGDIGSGEASSSGKVKSAMDARDSTFKAMDEKASNQTSGFAWEEGAASKYQAARKNAVSSQKDLADSFDRTFGDKSERSATFAADVAAKIGAGMSVGMALKGQSAETVNKAEAWAEKESAKITKAQDDSKTLSSEASKAAKYSEGHSDSEGRKDAAGFGQTITNATNATEDYKTQATKGFAFSSGLQGKLIPLSTRLATDTNTAPLMALAETGYTGEGAFGQYRNQARATEGDMIRNNVPAQFAHNAAMLKTISDAAASGNDQNATNFINGLAQAQGFTGTQGSSGDHASIGAPGKNINSSAVLNDAGWKPVSGVTQDAKNSNHAAFQQESKFTPMTKSDVKSVNASESSQSGLLNGPSTSLNGRTVDQGNKEMNTMGPRKRNEFTDRPMQDLAQQAFNNGGGYEVVEKVREEISSDVDGYTKAVKSGYDNNSFVDTALNLPFVHEAAAAIDGVGSPAVNAIENVNKKLDSQNRIIAGRSAPPAWPVRDIPD